MTFVLADTMRRATLNFCIFAHSNHYNLFIMEKYDYQRFKDIAEDLCNTIEEYLAHHTQYPTDVVVGISDETRKILLDSPDKLPVEYKQYSIADFIMINENGLYEPDTKVIFGDMQ